MTIPATIPTTRPRKKSAATTPRKDSAAPTGAQRMEALYQRLKMVGFDKSYVQSVALPDWWEDGAAGTPAGYAHAVGMIAGNLGLEIASLYEDGPPRFARVAERPLYKLKQNADPSGVELASGLTLRVAQIIAHASPEPSRLPIPTAAAGVRRAILATGARAVTFDALADYCWSQGVAVVHLPAFPRNARKMDAAAVRVAGGDGAARYVIVLCCARKPDAWHLFHLAHELGHIALGHLTPPDEADFEMPEFGAVRPKDAFLIDEDIDNGDRGDIQER